VGEQPPEYQPYEQPYQQPYQQQPHPYGEPPAPYGVGPAARYGVNPAPYGVDPITGAPYSDKTKLVAGLLQIIIPLGIGRMYMGQTGLGVAQLLVTIFTCGLGSLWPFIDGIMILAGNPKDALGRPMKMT
jgi:hypothetical protein